VLAWIVFQLRREGTSFDWAAFRATFSQLDWGWLSLAALTAYATYFGRALRWAAFLGPLRRGSSLWGLTEATIIGFTAVILLGRPGEFVRPYLISVKQKLPLPSQLAVWFIERIFDLLFALLIFGYALSRVRSSRAQVGGALQWVFVTGGGLVWLLSGICLLLLVLLGRYPEVFRSRLLAGLGFLHEHHMQRVENLTNSFLEGLEALRSTRAILAAIGYTALEWLLIAVCYLCIMRSFGGISPMGVIDILIYMGFVAFGTIVQLPGIGGGMQVVSVLVLHEIFGIPVEVATSMTLVIWIITFIILVPVGLPLALHQGLNWRKLKALGEESRS
jgi:uncharacterized membrane protein YbhN (UPF0104 family)